MRVMYRRTILPFMVLSSTLAFLLPSCTEQEQTVGMTVDTLTIDSTENDGGTSTVAGRPEGWEYESHDKSAPADYATVFPDNVVNRMDITISDSAWKALNDDMASMAGTFGSGGGFGGMGGGGMGGDMEGGIPPVGDSGAGDMGGMPTVSDRADGGNATGGMPGMIGGQVPQAFIDAAIGKLPGDSCSCTMMGMTLTGLVDTTGGTAFCKPQMPDPGQMGGGGGGMGGGMGNTEFLPREPVYIPVTVEFNGKTWTKVGFRLKGNSSLVSAWGQGTYKLPFRMKMDEFEDAYPEIKNQRMYGFKDLSFANNYMDNSMIHEKMAADLFRGFGVPAAKSAFVRLYVDYGQGKKYFGLYTIVEVPDNKPFLVSWFTSNDGNLYKPDGSGAYFSEFDESSFEEKNSGKKSCKDVKAVFTALHGDRSSPVVWRSNLEAVFDVQMFLKWLAVNTVIGNWDAYGSMPHNYYLYNTNNRLTWIAWDLGLSFSESGMFGGGGFGGDPGMGGEVPQDGFPGGTIPGEGVPADIAAMPGFGGAGGNDAVASIMHDQTDSTWPLIRFLLDDQEYRAVYQEFLRLFITTGFTANLVGTQQSLYSMIAPYVTGNEAEQTGYTTLSSPADFETAHTSLGQFIIQRITTVDSVLTVVP